MEPFEAMKLFLNVLSVSFKVTPLPFFMLNIESSAVLTTAPARLPTPPAINEGPKACRYEFIAFMRYEPILSATFTSNFPFFEVFNAMSFATSPIID